MWQPVELHGPEPRSTREEQAEKETLAQLGIELATRALAAGPGGDDRRRGNVFDREAEGAYVGLPPELVFRGLLELDLVEPAAGGACLWDHGTIETPFEFPRPGYVHPIFDAPPDLADVRAFLYIARALALHWIVHKEGGDVVEPWQAIDNLWTGFMWSEEVSGTPENTDDAWVAFVTLLNEGLRPYQARAEYVPHEFLETETTIGWPHPDLYSGLCLQLLNIITEDLPILRCANSRCERVFIRQEGRASKGQHRTAGVMYCSRQCARAQANRNYRQ